jgi:hypothetical protein
MRARGRGTAVGDFDLSALFAALEAQRLARGLSWAQAVNEINVVFDRLPSRPISRSTVVSLKTKLVAEGDGILQMLRWLDRSPESFVVGGVHSSTDAQLARLRPGRILRFDTRALHVALNARRVELGFTWADVSRAIPGATPSTLRHLSSGGRTGFPHVVRLTQWLGRPVADFTRSVSR